MLLVASVYAAVNGVLAAPYAVGEAGVEALGRALRVELRLHGASAGVAYFGFIDTAMVREAFARPVIQELDALAARGAAPARAVGRAGEAIVRADQGRGRGSSCRGRSCRCWPCAGCPALDRRLFGDRHVRAAIARAEGSGARPSEARAGAWIPIRRGARTAGRGRRDSRLDTAL